MDLKYVILAFLVLRTARGCAWDLIEDIYDYYGSDEDESNHSSSTPVPKPTSPTVDPYSSSSTSQAPSSTTPPTTPSISPSSTPSTMPSTALSTTASAPSPSPSSRMLDRKGRGTHRLIHRRRRVVKRIPLKNSNEEETDLEVESGRTLTNTFDEETRSLPRGLVSGSDFDLDSDDLYDQNVEEDDVDVSEGRAAKPVYVSYGSYRRRNKPKVVKVTKYYKPNIYIVDSTKSHKPLPSYYPWTQYRPLLRKPTLNHANKVQEHILRESIKFNPSDYSAVRNLQEQIRMSSIQNPYVPMDLNLVPSIEKPLLSDKITVQQLPLQSTVNFNQNMPNSNVGVQKLPYVNKDIQFVSEALLFEDKITKIEDESAPASDISRFQSHPIPYPINNPKVVQTTSIPLVSSSLKTDEGEKVELANSEKSELDTTKEPVADAAEEIPVEK